MSEKCRYPTYYSSWSLRATKFLCFKILNRKRKWFYVFILIYISILWNEKAKTTKGKSGFALLLEYLNLMFIKHIVMSNPMATEKSYQFPSLSLHPNNHTIVLLCSHQSQQSSVLSMQFPFKQQNLHPVNVVGISDPLEPLNHSKPLHPGLNKSTNHTFWKSTC